METFINIIWYDMIKAHDSYYKSRIQYERVRELHDRIQVKVNKFIYSDRFFYEQENQNQIHPPPAGS